MANFKVLTKYLNGEAKEIKDRILRLRDESRTWDRLSKKQERQHQVVTSLHQSLTFRTQLQPPLTLLLVVRWGLQRQNLGVGRRRRYATPAVGSLAGL